jgi:hypothetical protein
MPSKTILSDIELLWPGSHLEVGKTVPEAYKGYVEHDVDSGK